MNGISASTLLAWVLDMSEKADRPVELTPEQWELLKAAFTPRRIPEYPHPGEIWGFYGIPVRVVEPKKRWWKRWSK
jgi:hypothetical protein